MFDDPHKRTFFSAPQSVQSLIAAFLEPGITVLTFITITLSYDERMDRPALTLCLLVFALTFPGRDRFREPLLGAAVEIFSSWVVLLAVLALCAYATRSFHFFENDVLLAWAAITPVLQWIATWLGRHDRAAQGDSSGVTTDGDCRRRERARGQGGAGAPGRRHDGRSRIRRLLRRPQRRAHRRGSQGRGARHSGAGRGLHQREGHPRDLHHAAARLAAAHRRAARAAAEHDGVALLRPRRVRHQHHPGPARGHQRRSRGRHLRNPVHAAPTSS